MKCFFVVFALLLSLEGTPVLAQSRTPVKIFGYFQNQFEFQNIDNHPTDRTTSFALQQLNMFLQKDFSAEWTSFVNIEMLNSFSTTRQTGALNLEEAWIKYRANEHFSIKMGLQIPIFNNLNEIKNRTPLLPYIIRPIAYETSFNEIVDLESFIPSQAFLQAYGFKPFGSWKLDYAAYLGNSPNIARNAGLDSVFTGRSGVDTTASLLFGGRVGLRVQEFKAGLSASYDRVNNFKALYLIAGGNKARFEELPRVRLGVDLSWSWQRLFLETEGVRVLYDDEIEDFNIDKDFFYTTLGCSFLEERLYAFASYWYTDENVTYFVAVNNGFSGTEGDFRLKIPNIGFSYQLNGSIRFKAHLARVLFEVEPQALAPDLSSSYYAGVAISAVFR